jgi:protein involved in polysaccharide export with SLBB domain
LIVPILPFLSFLYIITKPSKPKSAPSSSFVTTLRTPLKWSPLTLYTLEPNTRMRSKCQFPQGALSTFLSIALVAATGSAWAQTTDNAASVAPANVSIASDTPVLRTGVELHVGDYLLGPGDQLRFQVLGEPDYTQEEILVPADGKISLLGAGILDVNNHSIPEVTEMIRERLSHQLRHPQLALSVLRPRAASVYLAGAVMRPGMLQMSVSNTENSGISTQASSPISRMDFRLTNILAVGGGVSMAADLSRIEVHRAINGEVETVNLWKVLRGEDSSQDILVNSGDTILVPALADGLMADNEFETLLRSQIGPTTFPVRILGEASNPGVYEIEGRSPYLNTAIAKAGGYAPQARRNVVAIRRFTSENKFTDLFVPANKLDISLRPNDIVFIAENKLYKSGRYFRQVAEVLSPFVSVATIGASGAQAIGYGGWYRRYSSTSTSSSAGAKANNTNTNNSNSGTSTTN